MGIITGVIILVSALAIVPQVHAIVILPAIILIPLIKLIAIIVAAFSVPVVSGGVLFGKITKNYKLALAVSLLVFLAVIVVSAVILRITHPNNPWL